MNKYLEKIASFAKEAFRKPPVSLRPKKKVEATLETLSTMNDAHDGYKKAKKHLATQRRKRNVK